MSPWPPPLAPAIILAAAAGLFAARGLFGTAGAVRRGVGGHSSHVSVPVPWTDLGTIVGGTLGAVCLMTAVSLLFLRRSTDLTEMRAAA